MEEESKIFQRQFENDLKYIQKEIIAIQPEVNFLASNIDEMFKYVKFSRPLNAVSIINLTKKQYKNYWGSLYKEHSQYFDIIMEAIEEKFNNGLISAEEMIEKIKKSSDSETEKKNAIEALTVKENKNKETEVDKNGRD